jgi:hypothetical protein
MLTNREAGLRYKAISGLQKGMKVGKISMYHPVLIVHFQKLLNNSLFEKSKLVLLLFFCTLID